MTLSVKIGGTWRTVAGTWERVGGAWRQSHFAYNKVGGSWRNCQITANISGAWPDATAAVNPTSTANVTVPTASTGVLRVEWSLISGAAATVTRNKGGGGYSALTSGDTFTMSNGESFAVRATGALSVVDFFFYDNATGVMIDSCRLTNT